MQTWHFTGGNYDRSSRMLKIDAGPDAALALSLLTKQREVGLGAYVADIWRARDREQVRRNDKRAVEYAARARYADWPLRENMT